MDLLRVYIKGRPGQALVERQDFLVIDGENFAINLDFYLHEDPYPAHWDSRVKPGTILYMTFSFFITPASVCRREHGCTRRLLKGLSGQS